MLLVEVEEEEATKKENGIRRKAMWGGARKRRYLRHSWRRRLTATAEAAVGNKAARYEVD